MSEEVGQWDSFALVLIDVQKDFWTDGMPIAFPDFGSNVASLLSLCRSQDIDVIHLRAQFKKNKSDWMPRYRLSDDIPCIEGRAGARVFEYAAARGDEPVFSKQAFDGFLTEKLQAWLQDNGKQFLLMAGLVTSVCVLLTAAAASQRGYLVSVVEDCCADKPEAHVHTLERYPFVFEVTTLDDIVASRDGWQSQLDRLSG